jgi:chloramphenicol-sensitive protein RarD
VSPLRRGYLFAFLAYASWGVFPLYFKALRPAGPAEILAQRIVWSLVFVALLLAVLRRWRVLRELLRRPRTVAGIALAAAFIAINWGVYIYGVNSDHVVETSLGYFINPLVTVLLGVLVLHERLRPRQWLAIGVGGLAVAVLALNYGRLPWIGLTLACSFGSYGFIKKRLGLPAAEGLFMESGVLVLPALLYLAVLNAHGGSTFGGSAVHTAMLVASGVLTAVPLLLFAGAANRLPLTALGMMQYLTPTLQLGLGVLLYHEPMPPARLAGFALVWCALAIFTWDAITLGARPNAASAGSGASTATTPGARPNAASAAVRAYNE